MGVLAGPIAWVITRLWTAFDMAGAAFGVSTLAVIQVAFLRMLKEQRENDKELKDYYNIK